MERQFNRQHSARFRKFNINDNVYARHYQSQEWQPGIIVERNGGCIYRVKLSNGTIGRFHINQLCRRKTSINQKGEEEDPWITLMDSFSLPTRTENSLHQNSEKVTVLPNSSLELCSEPLQEVRRSSRVHRPPSMLTVDPQRKSYRETLETRSAI